MTNPSPSQPMDAAPASQLLLPPVVTRKFLTPPPLRESPLSPADVSARAVVVTHVLWEVLARTEAVPHGGINE